MTPCERTSGWRAHLRLDYRRDGERTVAHVAHSGPLRVLQSLYPEGPGICHHVIVHPPGGVVGGDTLQVEAQLQQGTHVLVTTPGATRFYRSEGALALQQATLRLAEGARLEWLPLEAIAYSGCRAGNHVRAELAPGAQMIGWDIVALGLPAATQPFQTGFFEQQLELPRTWLERGRIVAGDTVLLNSSLGLDGQGVLATLWFAAGTPLPATQREALLEAARDVVSAHALAPRAGATAPQAQVVVLRVLAAKIEAVMDLLTRVRGAWRQQAWGLPAVPPRIWRT